MVSFAHMQIFGVQVLFKQIERWNLSIFLKFSRPNHGGLAIFGGFLERLVTPRAGDCVIDRIVSNSGIVINSYNSKCNDVDSDDSDHGDGDSGLTRFGQRQNRGCGCWSSRWCHQRRRKCDSLNPRHRLETVRFRRSKGEKRVLGGGDDLTSTAVIRCDGS
ncbi:hypothetical protein F0562_025560 [Nyssa sinensis]|uniref:Uncharacterized protein n=1 Tax=Nyssa sinensis TaxID=561372 RepID=A0A5J5B8A8_9ASTE|nr:hypothetical protein F0562_025560 [Nyssa sinensis]